VCRLGVGRGWSSAVCCVPRPTGRGAGRGPSSGCPTLCTPPGAPAGPPGDRAGARPCGRISGRSPGRSRCGSFRKRSGRGGSARAGQRSAPVRDAWEQRARGAGERLGVAWPGLGERIWCFGGKHSSFHQIFLGGGGRCSCRALPGRRRAWHHSRSFARGKQRGETRLPSACVALFSASVVL